MGRAVVLSNAAVRRAWLTRDASVPELAATLGVCDRTLRLRARALGLPPRATFCTASDDEIRRVWLDWTLTRAQAAHVLGIDPKWLAIRARVLGLRGRRFRVPDDVLRAAWFDTRLTYDDLAAKFGMTPQAISRRARLLGLPHRAGLVNPRHAITCPDFAAIWRAGVPAIRIAEHYDVARNTVTATAARMGLPTRPRRAAGPASVEAWHLTRVAAAEQAELKRRDLCDKFGRKAVAAPKVGGQKWAA